MHPPGCKDLTVVGEKMLMKYWNMRLAVGSADSEE